VFIDPDSAALADLQASHFFVSVASGRTPRARIATSAGWVSPDLVSTSIFPSAVLFEPGQAVIERQFHTVPLEVCFNRMGMFGVDHRHRAREEGMPWRAKLCKPHTSGLTGGHYPEHHRQIKNRGMNDATGEDPRSGFHEVGHVI
jgi:hypothetical protein